MTQISRPFQIVLAAFALFVVVWFVALRAHNSSTTGGSGSGASGSSSATVTHPASAAHAKVITPATTTTTTRVHRSANATALTVKRSASSAAGHTAGQTTVRHTTAVHSNTAAGHTTVVHTTVVKHTPPAVPKPVPSKTKPATGTPGMQIAVEHELQQGKTVLILFWNSKGADDVAVHNELPAVQHSLGGKVAVHYASANQVGEYGTITHAVQVNQTPTLLIVNPHGQTTTLTGLTDSFSIEQSISEANHP
jgi:hypothetical protein